MLDPLLIFLLREDGEIVSDAMDFEVDGVLSNVLQISMDKKQAFPGRIQRDSLTRTFPCIEHFVQLKIFLINLLGSTVDITMKAKPNSFVGILAVDRSVRSLQVQYTPAHQVPCMFSSYIQLIGFNDET